MEYKSVDVYEHVDKGSFESQILAKREPAVLRGLNLGSAVDKWTAKYLAESGRGRLVKVHVCPTPRMDFINKNFVYRTLPFDDFVHRACEDIHKEYFISPEEKYYLRSLGDDPRKDVADLETQFPSLAADIKIPKLFPEERFFSSVFRISSAGGQLWTHYDIMDNLLIQVTGRKRVVLFSPRDASRLYLIGDKSEVLDIDNPDLQRFPKFRDAAQYVCELQPGDTLFIPALWFHNVTALEFGVAVNVFWKHLDDSFYDVKDTYGNKDLIPAARASQIMDRALKALEEMPEVYRDFYARRIVAKVKRRCYSVDDAGEASG